MDWDGIGTAALFLSSGCIGLGLIWLNAYKSRLKAKLEHSRLHAQSDGGFDELRQEMQDVLDHQDAQIAEMSERLDFAERLLAKGTSHERTEE